MSPGPPADRQRWSTEPRRFGVVDPPGAPLGHTLTRRSLRVQVAVLLTLVTVLLGCSEDRTATGEGPEATRPAANGCGADDLLACARESSLAPILPDEPTAARGEPLRLGMINQESGPVGSFPELSRAVQAAVEWVNAELGGVDGRPVELEVCDTGSSPEGSTACAQRFVQSGVPAVLGGIDVFGNGIDTLADNGIPFVGGIPVSQSSVTAETSFQWSGGTWGATVAFAHHAATEVDAERVAIVYGDYGPIAQSARYGETALEALGVRDVVLVPFPITATDLTSPVQAAATTDPDAVVMLTADTGCQGAFDALAIVGLDVQQYYVGACADPSILDDVDADRTEGAIFNVEVPIDVDDPDPDVSLYAAVVDTYGDGLAPEGAGTVSFRSFLNLYRVLLDLDRITPAAITSALRGQEGAPSFMGHDSTCDGEQMTGLPALCSPQQILVQRRAGELVQLGDWVDVGEIYGEG